MAGTSDPTELILGIETSCDETAASVVANGRRVLSNVIASQDDLHAEYRGVVPEIASRAHAERILPIVRRAVSDAGVSLRDIRAVAVGNRPGLIGCLLVGVAAAKSLAWSLGIPFTGVDHIHAHLYAGCLDSDLPAFPALGLVVSGGHTSLFRVESPTAVTRLGGTIDDAIGEAYDKVATILGIPFPGGPKLDKLAQTGNPKALDFPVSRLGHDSLDFSFSGLKTAVLYAVRGVPSERSKNPAALAPTTASSADVAASFQRAAVRAVILKLERALNMNPDTRSLLVGGGVSANSLLRAELQAFATKARIELRLPSLPYCLDNAAMIAGLAHHILTQRNWTSDPLSLSADPVSA
jgi:N6-L-threonylcarbamoyladenine synthase